jgi:RHS repeat-associated protein
LLTAAVSADYNFSYWRGRLSQVRYPTEKSIGPVLVENVVNYGYDPITELLNSSSVCQMSGNDLQSGSRKNDTQFEYKAAKRSVGVISTGFTGTPVRYFFNYDGAITTVTDPRGGKFDYTHYDSGQCYRITYPNCKKADGTAAARPAPVYYTYNGDFQLKTVTQSKEVYDPATDTETATNIVNTYSYNSTTGNLESVIADNGPGGKQLTTVIAYEPEHNGVFTDIKAITDAKGQTTTYQNMYDSNGKLTQLKIIPPPNPDSYTITHALNLYGERITKDVTAGSINYHFGYGYQNGLLTTLSNYYGTTVYEYSIYGELKSTTDANKVKTKYQITANTGQLKAVFSPQEYPVNQHQFAEYLLPENQSRYIYDYDANGNKTNETDANGNVSYYAYNELNLLTSSLKKNVQAQSYYDANGNQISIYDNSQTNTSFLYDAMNRKIQTKRYGTTEVPVDEELEYDSSGRVQVRWDAYKIKNGVPLKNGWTEYFYDRTDNLICTKYHSKAGQVYTSSYNFDQNGNMIYSKAPLSVTMLAEINAVIETNYEYDPLNKPAKIMVSCAVNSKYNQTVSYTYEAGQLKSMKVSVAGGPQQTYTYKYDAAMRMDSIINQGGQMFKFEYFAGGQRKKKSVFKTSTDPVPFMTVGYSYDEAYLLKNLDYRWGTNYTYRVTMGYEYGLYNGMEKIISNPVSFNLNAPEVANYLLSQQGPEHDNIVYPELTDVVNFYQNKSYTNSYAYDDLGRMTVASVSGINPQLVSGLCNVSDHNPKVLFRSQNTRNTEIDPNGNLKKQQLESRFDTTTNVSTVTNYYNHLNQLTAKDIYNPPPSGTSTHTTYTYDDSGNLLGESGQWLETPPTYTFGPDQQMSRSFSESEHETKKKYENGQWVDVQNCYTLNDKTFVYQLGGKLLKIKSINHDDSNIYNRIDDNFTDYFYYSHDGAVAERHDDINTVKYFTRLGGELLACDNGGTPYFYIQNIRGDVMMMVDATGKAISIRDYDASGQMLCKSPGHTDRDPFGFTGGMDVGGGLVKLGARLYDSSKSAFIQQDRYMGDPSDPLSLNRYVYCGLDPVNYVDPTGFMAENIMRWGFSAAGILECIPGAQLAGAVVAGVVVVAVVGAIIYEAARDKMHPDPLAEDAPHSVYQRNGTTGKIKKYETYGPQTNPKNPTKTKTIKRYDGEGEPHDGVEPPHVHEGDNCRPANPDEIPGG